MKPILVTSLRRPLLVKHCEKGAVVTDLRGLPPEQDLMALATRFQHQAEDLPLRVTMGLDGMQFLPGDAGGLPI